MTPHLTTSEVAARLCVNIDMVTGYINSGELLAINVARKGRARPRWRIPADALAAFEQSRAKQVKPVAPRRKKRKPLGSVIEFF